MSKINIQGSEDVIDPFYRYKMNKLNVVRQRTKTVITNLSEVSKDLERDPRLITDHFKKKFNSTFILKDGLVSTTTDINYYQFETALKEFIEFYVLCEKCRLPETNFSKKDNKIILECRCCSNRSVKLVKK
jgi:translation initiation factor 2 beta subunit (eIF-2beta)/eIF-5